MADKTFISPGVFEKEIDLTVKGPDTPFGTPAAVIGESKKGPAFVPVTIASFKQFVDIFGEPDSDYMAPYAVREWLKNSSAATFMRVLGAGYGTKNASTAAVSNAGFSITASNLNGGVKFLCAQVAEQPGSGYLRFSNPEWTHATDANLLTGTLILGMMFLDTDVNVLPSSSYRAGDPVPAVNWPVAFKESSSFFLNSSSVDSNTPYMRLIISSSTRTYSSDPNTPNILTMDVTTNPFHKDYFANVMNTDPTQFETLGYVLYAHFPVSPLLATSSVNRSGIDGLTTQQHYAIMSGVERNIAGTVLASTPIKNSNGITWLDAFGKFDTRYDNAYTPSIMSQRFGSREYDLFHIEALSDGVWPNDNIKISINNIRKSITEATDYGTFTLLIREMDDTDSDMSILEQFNGLTLDPDDKNYICRKIGDKNIYYDHDQEDSAERRIIVDGDYPNVSKYIRIVPSDDLKNRRVPDKALPWGFRGYELLKTNRPPRLYCSGCTGEATDPKPFLDAALPPIPFRTNISKGTGTKLRANKKLYWGIKFEDVYNSDMTPYEDMGDGGMNDSLRHNYLIDNLAKFLGIREQEVLHTGSSADTFNSHKFSLEKVNTYEYSSSLDDVKYWIYTGSVYQTTTHFNPTDHLNTFSTVAKFSLFLHRGFDGVDIRDKYALKNTDAMEKENTQGVQANTIASYIEALAVIENKELADIQLLVIPGIKNQLITNEAIEVAEDRFDCMYIMDIEDVNSNLDVITGSLSYVPSVVETVSKFDSRNLDSNMAAAYWPDVKYYDDYNDRVVQVAPSVVVLGAYAFNDKVAHPWFVPAGFNRGGLPSVTEATVKLTTSDKDKLYDSRINPIASFPNEGVVVFGQKTISAIQSALDRVNVRRLLLELRRSVRSVAKLLVFEPNNRNTWNRFVTLVTPILARIQSLSGIEKFKIVMDETTTSQTDIQNNILRGKIFVQPTRAAEFIDLSFIITNNSVDFV